MKFRGKGIIWDAENKKTLVKFVKGEFETEDEALITKLQSLDIPRVIEDEKEVILAKETPAVVEGSDVKDASKDSISDDFRELRALAKEASIPGYMNMTKVELKVKLEELTQ